MPEVGSGSETEAGGSVGFLQLGHGGHVEASWAAACWHRSMYLGTELARTNTRSKALTRPKTAGHAFLLFDGAAMVR